ncbi:hypothetical protein ACFYO1_03030 [Nocardia sp. NPDC006044]|uniref:hypothetical protein n=1 Tax=Nocardia sp. NPDC006044 TaxID=3364306 RepID=UPI00369264FE
MNQPEDRLIAVPEDSVIRAALRTMIDHHIQSMSGPADPRPDGFLLWGVATTATTSNALACARIRLPAEDEDWSPMLSETRRFRARYRSPRLWGIGISWCGGYEAIAKPTDQSPKVRLGALLGFTVDDSEPGVGAMIFDAYRTQNACYMPPPRDGQLFPEFYFSDTRPDTPAWAYDCAHASPAATAWGQALALDIEANHDARAELMTHRYDSIPPTPTPTARNNRASLTMTGETAAHPAHDEQG